MPKVEQHVHIIGSIRPETLLWLLEENGSGKPFETTADIAKFFRYSDFSHFIDVYCTVLRCVAKEDQFERIVYEMLEDEARCNVRYVEASFSSYDHVKEGLDYRLMLDAINRGVNRAHQDFGIQCDVRVDLVRDYGPDVGMLVLDWIGSKRDNIVSIDIGGREDKFPPKPFAQVYQRAREMGLHLVAHAGETAGSESVKDAVDCLNVERIGHGIAADHDPELLDFLLARGITIETCPTSNVKTGVVPSLRSHPIRRFFDKGAKVTVNTDDPSMFNTDMNTEYLQLHRRLGFNMRELFQLTLNALDSSFLPEMRKEEMRESFTKEYLKLVSDFRGGRARLEGLACL